MKLYRVTGNQKYAELAKFFIDERGQKHSVEHPQFEPGSRFFMYNDPAYRQDHLPVTLQSTAVGHAVRATYLYSAMNDIAALFEPNLDQTLRGAFDDVTRRKMYVTGGLGADARTEAFGAEYALPNRAYAETCASVGGILWYQRQFLRYGEEQMNDAMERTLYNGYLSGVSLSGDRFFYQNPLVSDGRIERSAYFDVACCPANLSRLMAELPGVIYAQDDRAVYVNLFIGSEADLTVNGVAVKIRQETNYPWDGHVTIHIDPARPVKFNLVVHIPAWTMNPTKSALYRFADAESLPTTFAINSGKPIPVGTTTAAARLDFGIAGAHPNGIWQNGDVFTLDMPMPVRRVLANDNVKDDLGMAAIQRGPIVYALEAVDNGGSLKGVTLPLSTPLATEFRGDLLGGVQVVTGQAGGRTITAIPYYAWNNRGKGEMEVWIPY